MVVVEPIKPPRTTDPKELERFYKEVTRRVAYLTGANDPLTDAVVPRFISDYYYASTAAEWWVSHGLTATDWKRTTFSQQTTAISGAVFVQGGGNAVNDASTFDGYTLAQVVNALRTAGILA